MLLKKSPYLITIALCFFLYNFANAQYSKGKITYQVSLNSETYLQRLKKDTIMPDFRKELRLKSVSEATPINFLLLFNENKSLFKSEHNMFELRKLGKLMNKTGSVAGNHFTYYSNLDTKEFLYQSFWTDRVLVKSNPIEWKLTQETKKIGDYICYKAIAEIKDEQTFGKNFISPVIAWYTPQIPLPFGIQNFTGLPGLTLELIADKEDGKVFYKAIKIELNSKEEIKIKKPKGKLTTHEKYIEFIKTMNGKRK
jgi:GLPGLI family protein